MSSQAQMSNSFLTKDTIEQINFPEEIVGSLFKLRSEVPLSWTMKNKLFELAIEIDSRLQSWENQESIRTELNSLFQSYVREYKGKAEIYNVFFLNIFNVIYKYRGKITKQHWLLIRDMWIFNELFYPFNYQSQKNFSTPITVNLSKITKEEERITQAGKNRVAIYEYLVWGKLPEKYRDLTYREGMEVTRVDLDLFDGINKPKREFVPQSENLRERFERVWLPSDLMFLWNYLWQNVWFRYRRFITDQNWKVQINQRKVPNIPVYPLKKDRFFFVVSWIPWLWKTTLAKFMLSSVQGQTKLMDIDEIRREITGSEIDFSREKEVIQKRTERFIDYFSKGDSTAIAWTDGESSKGKVIKVDICDENWIPQVWTDWLIAQKEVILLDFALNLAKQQGYMCIWIYLNAPIEEIFENIGTRYRQITREWILGNMWKYSFSNFNHPLFDVLMKVNPREDLCFKKDFKRIVQRNLDIIK